MRIAGRITCTGPVEEFSSLCITVKDDDRVLVIHLPISRDGLQIRDRRACPISGFVTTEVALNDVILEETDVLLEALQVPEWITELVETTRLLVCTAIVVYLESAVRATVDYMAQREMDGVTLIDHQAPRHRLADVSADLLATYATAEVIASSTDMKGKYGSVLLAYALTRIAPKAVSECAQFYGGRGFLNAYKIASDYAAVNGVSGLMGRRDLLAAKISVEHAKLFDLHRLPRAESLPIGIEEFRRKLRNLLANEVAPNYANWDRAQEIPRQIFKLFGTAGITGLMIPPESGGFGGTFLHSEVLVEELMRYPIQGLATSLFAQSHSVLPLIAKLGTAAQKTKYLIPSISGDLVSSIAITEPAGGSDLIRAVRLRAERVSGGWRLNGEKLFITNGPISDFMIVLARTDVDRGALGMTLFIVDKGASGLSRFVLNKFGMPASSTGWLRFDNCIVSDGAVLGEIGDGFRQAIDTLVDERLMVSLMASEMTSTCIRSCLERYGNRFRNLPDTLADMMAMTYVVSCFVRSLTRQRESDELAPHEVSCAKFRAAELLLEVLRMCGAVVGSDYPGEYIEICNRDARMLGVFAGSSETMRESFASNLAIGAGIGTGGTFPGLTELVSLIPEC
ncbi:acyl-CoA dehydrogenase family protein [Nocardia transvalensis]|uniref:acyl-CoA dehydrogenase family protein n=1 Tax=Nocardia transvalensis TaxID=37333 RepID=UPI001893A025|nr:acyl-CoA dehydrogenase family protein [Nocardia transvalensis]MBF6332420.1 acyl-CoA/acyl-ACP dehydrogenase [Nocardia transvalensis]